MRPADQRNNLAPAGEHSALAPALGIPLSLRARQAICARIGHSRVCCPAEHPADTSYSCGRCGTPQRTSEHPYAGWRTFVAVHDNGRLCSFCVEAYQTLRWHDWLFLLPGVAATTLAAMERAAAEARHD